jgi:hypothetical protein
LAFGAAVFPPSAAPQAAKTSASPIVMMKTQAGTGTAPLLPFFQELRRKAKPPFPFRACLKTFSSFFLT